MRRVAHHSIEKGKVTLIIPTAYKGIAERLEKKAREYGKTFSSLVWELIDEHLKEEEELLPRVRARGKAFHREDLYEELLDRKIRK